MSWEVVATEAFSAEFRKFERHKEFVDALDKKIKKLIEDPTSIGAFLSGRLHGYKSMRLVKNFRIVFRLSLQDQKVYLIAIDHRKNDYENF